MTTNAIRIAPPNSLILVEDYSGGEVPNSMGGSLVSATSSCIAVGCRSEDDGETEIVLAFGHGLKTPDSLAFQGTLETPSKSIVVRNIHGATLLQSPVSTSKTTVRIWANHSAEPDRITVEVIA